MNPAPIACFVYNRPLHTKHTIEALQKNTLAKESRLFIFSDAPKNEDAISAVNEVRAYLSTITGFKDVRLFKNENNLGCDPSIRKGVTDILSQFEKIIVIEDDIVTAPNFLEYMNDALDLYEKDDRIWSISGYVPPFKIYSNYTKDVFPAYRVCSWGWGTWIDRWNSIDWNKSGVEEIFTNKQIRKSFCRAGEDLLNTLRKYPEAWDITSYYSQWKQNKYTVYPVRSLVKNTGIDGSGTHFTEKQDKYNVEIPHDSSITLSKDIYPDQTILRSMKKFYTKNSGRKLLIKTARFLGIYDFLLKRFAK